MRDRPGEPERWAARLDCAADADRRAHRRRAPSPSFSFEFFPPKTEEGERNLGRALAELSRLDPTFVSVTYGAGGSDARSKTIDIVSRIKADYGLEAMAHFTCVGATVDGAARRRSTRCATRGIENVLALRGDPPQGQDGVDRDRGRPASTRAS